MHNRIFEHVAQFARINLYCANLHIQGRSTFLLTPTDLTHRDGGAVIRIMKQSFVIIFRVYFSLLLMYLTYS